MIWQDVFFNRILTKHEIIAGLCDSFSLNLKDVFIGKSLDDIPQLDTTNISILCISGTTTKKTEFPICISFYILKEGLISESNTIQDDISRIASICSHIKCKALIGDETVNPYAWIQINETGNSEKFIIDSNYDEIQEVEMD